jgi:serine-type D-Ala-D-Ala carboxypeptidase/endopeptidase (penicillin-binding protein 4)
LYADRLIRAIWSERGGRILGVVRESATANDANSTKLLAKHESRTLAEFNRDIVKRSDNPITRMTYLTLGAQSDGTLAKTSERAEAVVRQWLAKHRIDATGLVLHNGSGLSRSERITAITLAEVLRVGYQSVWAPEFMAMFPIVGVDGGMRNRLLESGIASRARLKTGTLRNTMALAGFVPDASGQMHAVVTIVNHDLAIAKVGRPIIDAMIDWIAKTDLRTLNPDAPARQ